MCPVHSSYSKSVKELDIDLHSFVWGKSKLPDQKELKTVLSLMQDPDYVVLVHCVAGVDRTGYAVARYRVLQQNWPLKKALREMRRFWHKKNIYDQRLEEEFEQKAPTIRGH